MTGTITFAPAARVPGPDGALSDVAAGLAVAPASGCQIRLWYAHGGGSAGNVAAGTLTVLKDPVAGLQVSNPAPATGGRDAETVDNALVRGPRELHSLERAVTARDFELRALASSGGVSRAKAFTRSMLWAHASPGTVEVVLVPDLPAAERHSGRVRAETMIQYETEEVRGRIGAALDERRPLGTVCLVTWGRYKTVSARARVVAHRQEDHAALSRRVIDRLYRTISPLPSGAESGGWPFGQALRTSHVYDVTLSEPGVSYVDRVELIADEVPASEIQCLAADAFQADTWYAGSASTLFRSVDDGDGWEAVAQFPGELVDVVVAHASRPGLIAVSTRLAEGGGSRVHLSGDCGETWTRKAETAFTIQDLAWGIRKDVATLLLATDAGLFELATGRESSPVQVLVHPGDQDRGFYAVAVWGDLQATGTVAVASQRMGGVFVSTVGGRASSFRNIDSPARMCACSRFRRKGRGPISGQGWRRLARAIRAPGAAAGSCCRRETIPRTAGSSSTPIGTPEAVEPCPSAARRSSRGRIMAAFSAWRRERAAARGHRRPSIRACPSASFPTSFIPSTRSRRIPRGVWSSQADRKGSFAAANQDRSTSHARAKCSSTR